MQDIVNKILSRLRGQPEEKTLTEDIPEEEKLPTYSPPTLKAFLQIIKNTPMSVLSASDRVILASAISFREKKVSDIMLPREKITFVYEHDFLGPLMLDKLFQTGYSHFPVLSSDGKQVIGIIHTASLNSLEIRANERAGKYVDERVYYLRNDYTLDQAMAAFLRTNSFFYMVVNNQGKTVGLLTYKMLVRALLGYEPNDDFDGDSNLAAIMKRPSNTATSSQPSSSRQSSPYTDQEADESEHKTPQHSDKQSPQSASESTEEP